MYAVAYFLLKEHHLAEDAVHDSFMKIIKHFEKCKSIPHNEIEGWIVIIVKHTALDILKKNKKYQNTNEDLEIDSNATLEDESNYHTLLEIIRSMPDNYREILELKYVLEWTNIEIARHLNTNENAVAAKLFRARKKLHVAFEKEGITVDGHTI